MTVRKPCRTGGHFDLALAGDRDYDGVPRTQKGPREGGETSSESEYQNAFTYNGLPSQKISWPKVHLDLSARVALSPAEIQERR